MKVEDSPANVWTEKGSTVERTVPRNINDVNASFRAHLNRAENDTRESKLNELMECIIEQGKILARKADIKELRKYRKYVSQFLSEALAASHEFTKQNILDRRGRSRVYAIIRKVDAELDQLTKEILSSEKDNLKIAGLLDTIKGLILDMLL